MKTSIVIPVLNKWALTGACLESLRAHTSGEFEVLLVDNASSDATPMEAPNLGRALFGANFVYLPQPVNRNFAAACNLGARAATGDLLFFLNNDTLLTPGWLPPLQAALAGEGAPACAGPLLLFPDLAGRPDRVQHLGIAFDPQLRARHLYEGFPARHPLCAKERRFQALTGAALLLRRDLFLARGLFDEDFINGLEDVEFGLRLGRDGLCSQVVRESVVYHLASQTPGVHAQAVRNAKLLRAKAGELLRPDLPALGAADGYVFRLGPDLAGYFDLPADRSAALDKKAAAGRDAAGMDAEALRELLEAEPLWHRGYTLLAAAQEAAGELRAAADTVFLALRFREDPRLAARLLDLAQRTRHSRYAAQAGKILAWYRPENFPPVSAAAGRLHEFCLASGQEAAAGACAQWLERKEEWQAMYERLGRPASPDSAGRALPRARRGE